MSTDHLVQNLAENYCSEDGTWLVMLLQHAEPKPLAGLCEARSRPCGWSWICEASTACHSLEGLRCFLASPWAQWSLGALKAHTERVWIAQSNCWGTSQESQCKATQSGLQSMWKKGPGTGKWDTRGLSLQCCDTANGTNVSLGHITRSMVCQTTKVTLHFCAAAGTRMWAEGLFHILRLS